MLQVVRAVVWHWDWQIGQRGRTGSPRVASYMHGYHSVNMRWPRKICVLRAWCLASSVQSGAQKGDWITWALTSSVSNSINSLVCCWDQDLLNGDGSRRWDPVEGNGSWAELCQLRLDLAPFSLALFLSGFPFSLSTSCIHEVSSFPLPYSSTMMFLPSAHLSNWGRWPWTETSELWAKINLSSIKLYIIRILSQ